jgi:predicted acyltransferase
MVTTAIEPAKVEGAARLLSLDAFRGLTMASMVIVNNPGDWGSVYAPLLHAEWNGCTPTDLIFPFFLFMVGVSMTLSRRASARWSVIARRAATIVILGWLLSLFPFFPATRFLNWRLPGVLVRIGLCYFAAAAIMRASAPVGERDDRRHGRRLSVWVAALTLGYWVAMVWMPWPGHTPGDLSPAGNLGAFIDRAVLGQRHLWQQRPWDPEGLASTVPAVATTLLGILAGFWMRSGERPAMKALVLASAGAAGMALGLLWDLAFPINKNLWTSSYVMFTGGAAAVSLAACYWVIDVKGWRRWAAPFVILGMNAIALFMLSGLLAKTLGLIKWADAAGKPISLHGYLYGHWVAPLAAPKNASLLFALAHLAVMFGILAWMYRRRIFLKA